MDIQVTFGEDACFWFSTLASLNFLLFSLNGQMDEMVLVSVTLIAYLFSNSNTPNTTCSLGPSIEISTKPGMKGSGLWGSGHLTAVAA